MSRADRVAARLAERELDLLLVTDAVNIRYLTGFTGSNAMLIVRAKDAVFLTDFRYLERVRPLREFLEVRQVNQEIMRPAADHLAALVPDGGMAGFEGEHLSHVRTTELAERIPAGRL